MHIHAFPYMRGWLFCAGWLFYAALLTLPGCTWGKKNDASTFSNSELEHYQNVSAEIEYPDVESSNYAELAATARPNLVSENLPKEHWDMTLQEAIQLALTNSKVLRNLGSNVIQIPDGVQSIFDPAIQQSDPRFGEAAALSAFDANWSTGMFFEKNDRAVNNQFFGGGTRLFKQDLLAYNSELYKRTPMGTELTARHTVDYDFNNSPGNDIPNLPWATALEMEARQPIYLGGAQMGYDFHRIAGPDATPGVYNGVLIARINADINLAQFEKGIRDLIDDVETAYWDLYQSYRNVSAKIAARDRALLTWRRIHALHQTGRRGGEAEREAQAREQYFRLKADVINELQGRLQQPQRSTYPGNTRGGLYVNERRLRLMTGLPINGDRVIRPSDEPDPAKVIFNWDEIVAESLMRKVELREQKWKIKQRELELIAAKNYLYPEIDAVGRYRWRGLGHDLVEPNGDNRTGFNDAVHNLSSGRFQEWQLGFELKFPVGFRQAHAAVRNAKLKLVRERALLREQQREIIFNLSTAFAEVDRSYTVAHVTLNRLIAAREQLRALEAELQGADENKIANLLTPILDAQRRLSDAESSYHTSMREYTNAIKQVHLSKGSLLEYNAVRLAEGPWPAQAHRDAAQRDRLRMKDFRLDNYIIQRSPIVSQGTYPQDIEEGSADAAVVEEVPPRPRSGEDLPND